MKVNMVYYQIHLFQSNTFVYHCIINQTLQNGQTLGQFFERLYHSDCWTYCGHQSFIICETYSQYFEDTSPWVLPNHLNVYMIRGVNCRPHKLYVWHHQMGTVCCTSGHHHGLELWCLYTVFLLYLDGCYMGLNKTQYWINYYVQTCCCEQCVPNEKPACFQYSLDFSPILLWWVLCKLCHHCSCVYDIRLCGMCWIQ